MAGPIREKGGRSTGQPRDRTPTDAPLSIDLTTIAPEELDRQGEKWGKDLAGHSGVKTNQIRNLYATVQHIRVRASRPQPDTEDINRRLVFLKPKLAYASGRQPALKGLRNFLVQAIDSVIRSEDPPKAQENFFILMESIVAYHKFHGGKDYS